MADKKGSNLPDQKELEKELAEYLSRKYGERVKVISTGIVAQSEQDEKAGDQSAEPPPEEFDFDIRPEELISYLDEYVVKQDEAKAVLATKICTHFNRVRYSLAHPLQKDRDIGRIKNNVLLIGPTGVGKTYIIKLIAQRLGVPFVKGDATKFSETGYVGGDVEDLVRDLVRQADGDVSKARFGIIYVDEIDKIAASPQRIGQDVSRTGVQRALLKPMEETDVEMKVGHDPVSQIEAIEHYRQTGKREMRAVNTRNILFIMSGAFGELDEIIRRRVQQQGMGFESSISSKKEPGRFLKQVKAEDLIAYGFESEFVGRLPVLAVLDSLSVEDLFAILDSLNSSLIIAKKQDFRAYGIDIQFSREALSEIAVRAHLEQTGARGLVSVIEKVLLQFEKKLPSTSIPKLAVSRAMVDDPTGELARLLRDDEARAANQQLFVELSDQERERFYQLALDTVAEYMEEYEVLPTPGRLDLLARQCQEEYLAPRDLVDALVDRVDLVLRFARQISAKCGVEVEFSEEAVDRILARRPWGEKTVRSVCQALEKDFEYGLGLLGQKKDVKKVIIPPEGIDEPRAYMENLVSSTFRL